MTTTADTRSPKSDSITAHHYVLPVVSEIPSARREISRAHYGLPAAAGELETLLFRAAERDHEAWTLLVRRFSPRIRAVACAQHLNSHDVEDVVQTTWLELMRYIDRIREPAKLGAWLHSTARRESTRTAIAARRENPIDEVVTEPSEPSEGEARVVAAERSKALADALQALPSRQRALMCMLLTDHEPSYAEISSALDMPIGSIGPTRARCLERLRDDQNLASVIDDDLRLAEPAGAPR